MWPVISDRNGWLFFLRTRQDKENSTTDIIISYRGRKVRIAVYVFAEAIRAFRNFIKFYENIKFLHEKGVKNGRK